MFSLKTFWLAFVLSALAGGVLALFPLVGLHGVESALILGLLLPPFVCALGAATLNAFFGFETPGRGVDVMARAMGASLLVLLPALVLLGANAIHFRQCTPWEGLAFMLLGPGVGCLLAAAVGVWIAALLGGSRAAPWIAWTVPLLSLGIPLWLLWSTPAVSAFGVFAGYYPGSLYDQGGALPDAYLSYRGATLLLIASLWMLFEAAWQGRTRHASLVSGAKQSPGWLFVGFAGLTFVGALYWHGEALSHRVSDSGVVEALGKTEVGQRCIVHMPRELTPEAAARMVADCDFHVYFAEEALGVTSEAPVVAYLFRTAQEKKKLIGVGATYVAKPWRDEIYLQLTSWPHPVLGHEVVHVVAGAMASPPLKISGRFAGLLPNPGLIEGAAVSVAWRRVDGLDPDQWSRVMLEYEKLPQASKLMSLGFGTLPALRAYAAAGSLVRHLARTRGESALKKAYRSGEVSELVELEKDWHSYLNTVPITEEDRAVAMVGLNRKSIFSAICPHQGTRLKAALSGDIKAADYERIIESCRKILAIDNRDTGARAELVGALAASGEEDTAHAELDVLRDHLGAPQPTVARALEKLADAYWGREQPDRAAELYEELLGLPQPDDRARGRELKAIAIKLGGRQSELIHDLLGGRQPARATAVHLARELGRLRSDGLGQYLEARQLIQEGRFDLALPLLEWARELGLPTARLRRENERLLGVTLYANGRLERSERVWDKLRDADGAVRQESERWLRRIALTREGKLGAGER